MGRGGRSRTQRKHFKQPRENVWKRSPNNGNNNENGENPAWQPLVHQNSAFEEYYKEQGIVSPEEWDAFMDSLRKPLPAAFRINSSSQFCADIRSQLENEFTISLQSEIIDGDEIQAIRPLPWYPEKLAWHLNFSRSQLRKNQTLERFHEFLKLEHEIGNITRQEAVSMVPPLFLDVHPDHFVLDMCAAPGSKTFQLLEITHQSLKPGSLPEGLVVANDLDVQRCNLLIHQTKRMCTANLVVTNHEAQHLPGCRLKRNYVSISEGGMEPQPSINQLLFDRVLCDVPCSGDGTLRKAPDIWRKWNAGMGNGLHSLQVQIAMRGISLLKIGGRLVYSTCSMNPVENEAVVAEILRRCGGCIELIDVSTELPQLIRRAGLRTWKVRDRGAWLASHKDVPQYRRSSIIPSMFPTGRSFTYQTEADNNKLKTSGNGNPEVGPQMVQDITRQTSEIDEEVSDLPLEHCMRILPHDQNTGAFFIAVFHKISSLPATQEIPSGIQGILNSNNENSWGEIQGQSVHNSDVSEINSADDTNEKISEATMGAGINGNEQGASNFELDPCDDHVEQNLEEAKVPENGEAAPRKVVGKRRLQIQGKWRGVDPVVFFKDETVINSIKTFYGIKESFPFNGHLVTRNNDSNSVKRIYYVSEVVKDVLELNFKVGEQLKITSVGLKMFERQSSREGRSTPCTFRISSEGLPLILPYITKQILHASPADFKNLLQHKSFRFADFADAELGEKASKLMPGCCVIVLDEGGKALSDPIHVDESTIAIGCWKGRASMNVMVTAMDCQELLERLSMRLDSKTISLTEKKNPSTVEANGMSEKSDIKMEEDLENINFAAES